MIAWLRRWRARASAARREQATRSEVEQRVRRAFATVYADRRVVSAYAHSCPLGHVTIVAWANDMQPPPRTFWLTDADGVREIDHDHAARLIHVPVWR